MKLLFWVVRNKANSMGLAPIYCRITINSKRSEINTGILVKPTQFCNKRKMIKGSSDLTLNQNLKLEELKHKLHNLYLTETLRRQDEISALELKELIENKCTNITLVLQLLYEYNAHKKKSIFDDRYLSILVRALSKLNKKTLQISKCTNEFLDNLVVFLRNDKGYAASYIKKVIGYLKGALRYAFNQRYVDRVPGIDYTVNIQTEKQFIYLDEREVNKIENHHFINERLEHTADIFLMQCYTGLAYVDLKRLGTEHLSQDADGVTWIDINRQKVISAQCTIPVINRAWFLLKKYSFNLPVISLQKYNKNLKQLANEVGIHKNLTSHVGRKTYGTLLLNKDVPVETVSALLGHSNVRITQSTYAKVLHMKVARDIKAVF